MIQKVLEQFKSQRWVGRYTIILGLSLLAIWVLFGGDDLGERAGFAQAVLATILLWATWSAIDRSDTQILKAQRQIDLSQELLTIESKPNLIVQYSEEDFVLRLTNLGKYPMLIDRTELYPLISSEKELQSVILKPLQSIKMDVPISDYYPELVKGELPLRYDLSIVIYYSNPNGRVWHQRLALWREEGPYMGERFITWYLRMESLTEEEDYKLFYVDKLGS